VPPALVVLDISVDADKLVAPYGSSARSRGGTMLFPFFSRSTCTPSLRGHSSYTLLYFAIAGLLSRMVYFFLLGRARATTCDGFSSDTSSLCGRCFLRADFHFLCFRFSSLPGVLGQMCIRAGFQFTMNQAGTRFRIPRESIW